MATKPRQRKRPTWTFQPEDDVRKLVEDAIGKSPERGEFTKLVNAAIRTKYKQAVVALEIAEMEKKLAVLKGKAVSKR